MLTGINVPLVMVGKDLNIRRFTPSIEPMLNLIDSDIGRSDRRSEAEHRRSRLAAIAARRRQRREPRRTGNRGSERPLVFTPGHCLTERRTTK